MKSRGNRSSPASSGYQLTPDEIAAVPARRAAGEGLGAIAESFGISIAELDQQLGLTRARHITWAKDRP